MGIQRHQSLSTFLDVLFALAFFRAVEYMPPFHSEHWERLPNGILSLLADEPVNLTRVAFALIMVVYCWCRKNTLMSAVRESNAILETLAAASMAFLFLFLYALVADPEYIGGPPTLLLQSLSFFLASVLSYAALRYAVHAGLTVPEMKPALERMARVDLANPLTALAAAALSWSGLIVWTLSWFVLMPLFSMLLARVTRDAGKPFATSG